MLIRIAAAPGDFRPRRVQHLADRVRGLRFRGPAPALGFGARRDLCHRRLRHSPLRRAHGAQDPAAPPRAAFHDHGRRPAGRPGEPGADRHIRAAARGASPQPAGWRRTGSACKARGTWRALSSSTRAIRPRPFSTLYLFGRGQDIGFQQAIDGSPRKRHHVRFWAKSLAQVQAGTAAAEFWLNTDRPDGEAPCCGSAPAPRTPASRSRASPSRSRTRPMPIPTPSATYIINALKQCGAVAEATLYQTGDRLITDHVNHYVTDGEIAVASWWSRRCGAATKAVGQPPPLLSTSGRPSQAFARVMRASRCAAFCVGSQRHAAWQ